MTRDEDKGQGELILYRTDDGRDEIQLRLADGSVWLTQVEIAALFDTTPQNITQHLRSIFAEGELVEGGNCQATSYKFDRRASRQVKPQR